MADPSHQRKVVAGKIDALAISLKIQSTCTSLDVMRFKMNFEYMMKRNRNKTLQEIRKGALAVIKHLFDEHELCEEEW